MANDDLSDEQLKQLLKDAEQRLRNKGKQQTQVSTVTSLGNRYVLHIYIIILCKRLPFLLLTHIISSIPKIAVEKSIEPYIKQTEHGPQVDPAHLVTEEQRKQANGIRVVEDPIAIKKRAAEVRYISFIPLRNSSVRKIYP